MPTTTRMDVADASSKESPASETSPRQTTAPPRGSRPAAESHGAGASEGQYYYTFRDSGSDDGDTSMAPYSGDTPRQPRGCRSIKRPESVASDGDWREGGAFFYDPSNSASVASSFYSAPHTSFGTGGESSAGAGRYDSTSLRTPASVADAERRVGAWTAGAAVPCVGRASRTSTVTAPARSFVTDLDDPYCILRTPAAISATRCSSPRPSSGVGSEHSDGNSGHYHHRRGRLATAAAVSEQEAPYMGLAVSRDASVTADVMRGSARGSMYGLSAAFALSERAAEAGGWDYGDLPLPRTPAAAQGVRGEAPRASVLDAGEEVQLERAAALPPLQAKRTARNFSARPPSAGPIGTREVLGIAYAAALLLAPERSFTAQSGQRRRPLLPQAAVAATARERRVERDAVETASLHPPSSRERPSLWGGGRRRRVSENDAALLLTPHEPPAGTARGLYSSAAARIRHAASNTAAGGSGKDPHQDATREGGASAAADPPSPAASSTSTGTLVMLPPLMLTALKPPAPPASLSGGIRQNVKADQQTTFRNAAPPNSDAVTPFTVTATCPPDVLAQTSKPSASSAGTLSAGLTSDSSQPQQRGQHSSASRDTPTAAGFGPPTVVVMRGETSAAHHIVQSNITLAHPLNSGTVAAATPSEIVRDDSNTSSSAREPAASTSTLPPPPPPPLPESTSAAAPEEVHVADPAALSTASFSSSSTVGDRPRRFFFRNGGCGASQASSGTELSGRLSARRRRVGFKEKMEVVLPDSKSLRGPGTAWLEFRNPTMREQGKELMPSTEEVFSHLSTRTNAVCSLVVVDEDAVGDPCLVVSGLSVRVFKEDKAVALANQRMAHGVMKAMTSHGGRGGLRHLRGVPSSDDEDEDDEDSGDEVRGALSPGGGFGLGGGCASYRRSGSSATPSNVRAFVLLPDKKDRRSRQGDSGGGLGEFDRYLHKFDVDETLSRAAGRKECPSVALELLMQTWVTGHNTCMLLGNGNGRSTHALDLAIGAVQNALSMLSERLRDPTSRVEAVITFGDVADEEKHGGVRVKDLLVTPPHSDDDDEAGPHTETWSRTSRVAAERRQRRAARELPAVTDDSDDDDGLAGGATVQLGRSPLLGTFAKGLREVRVADAIADSAEISRTLTQGFLQYNLSAHSSRSNSTSSLSNLSSAALRRAHTSFATVQLKTICRGLDMRNTRLTARETATMTGKKSKRVKLQCRSFEYNADVLVSSLLLVFFGTEFLVLDTLVRRSNAQRMMAGEEGGEFTFSALLSRPQRPVFRPHGWPNAIGFLQSLLCDALGGRTRTMSCLCLSEYDTRAALWLRTVCQARRLMNVTPNCGNVRNYLKYLLEQYDQLLSKQRRRKSTLEMLFSAGISQPPMQIRARAKRCGSVSRTPLTEWSTLCVETMIESLDNLLTVPTSPTPPLEQLAIATEEIAAAAQAAPPARLLPPRRHLKR